MTEEIKKQETEKTHRSDVVLEKKEPVKEQLEEKNEQKPEPIVEKPKEEEKVETKIEKPSQPEPKQEKEFTIPLRRKFGKTVRYKRAPKAIKAIKEFLLRHMKVYERDLKKIKLDKYLNEFIWTRGIRNPPSRVKVKAVVDGDFIRAELVELTEKFKFKKARLKRREEKSSVPVKKSKHEAAPEIKEKTKEEKAEEKEKKAAVIEAGQKMEKEAAKQVKKSSVEKVKQPKHQIRKALEK